MGFPLSFVDIDVDETLTRPVKASQVAESLALLKSEGYRDALAMGEVLVTADTVVVHDDLVMGKPHSRQEAVEMLHLLSGRVHQVYTGVCLRSCSRQRSFTDRTDVCFRRLTDAEIDYYVDHYKPFDKAGAYGIQEWIGMVGVSRIEGCFYNVMGLPVARLYEELKCLIDEDDTFVNELA